MQESILIQYINELSAKGLPPTSQLVKNFAEEIIGKELEQSWTGRFIQRYKNTLKSIYLTTINYKRKIADNSRHYNHFFHEYMSAFLYISPIFTYFDRY
jgi:hypothetical protein